MASGFGWPIVSLEKGQWCGKRFHVMTSSRYKAVSLFEDNLSNKSLKKLPAFRKYSLFTKLMFG